MLIVGSGGLLGEAFARGCEARGISWRMLTHREVDLGNEWAVAKVLAALQPWAVVNAAGYVAVDEAESDPARCLKLNAERPAAIASAAAACGAQFAAFSSDLVFDGAAAEPYVEGADTAPVNVFGRSKALMEALVHMLTPEALVIRTAAFFGPWDDCNFLTLALRAFAAGERFYAAEDVVVSPTYVPDLVNATLDLLIDRETGVWHLANSGAATWAEFARVGAEAAGVRPRSLIALPHDELDWAAARPPFSALGSERGASMPPLDDAIGRYAHAFRGMR